MTTPSRRTALACAGVGLTSVGLAAPLAAPAPAARAEGSSPELRTVAVHEDVYSDDRMRAAVFFEHPDTGRQQIAVLMGGVRDHVQIFTLEGKRLAAVSIHDENDSGNWEIAYHKASGHVIATRVREMVAIDVRDYSFRRIGYLDFDDTADHFYAPVVMDDRILVGTYPDASLREVSIDGTDQAGKILAKAKGGQYIRSLDAKFGIIAAGIAVQITKLGIYRDSAPEKGFELLDVPGAIKQSFLDNVLVIDADKILVTYTKARGQRQSAIYSIGKKSWIQLPGVEGNRHYADCSNHDGIRHHAWTYNLDAKTKKTLCINPYNGEVRPAARSYEIQAFVLHVQEEPDGRMAYTISATGEIRKTKLNAGRILMRAQLDYLRVPQKLNSVFATDDGLIYSGAYLGTGGQRYDRETGTRERLPLHGGQVESWGVLPDNKLIVSAYSRCIISTVDRETLESQDVHRLSEELNQSRPFATAVIDDAAFIGTVVEFGYRGGGVTALRGSDILWHTADPVGPQSVIGLIADGDTLYGTTSLLGGLGIDPAPGSPHVFAMDSADGKVLWSTPTTIAGAKMLCSPTIIKTGAGRHLYVGSTNGLHRIDLRTGRILKTWTIHRGTEHLKWRGTFVFGLEDNMVFFGNAAAQYVLDTVSGSATKLGTERVRNMALDPSTGHLLAVTGVSDVTEWTVDL